MENERTVHCPKCGYILRRIGIDIERSKGFGIVAYEMHCDRCGVNADIDDISNFEQRGKIAITFT
jgi:C4-type Zn-finger protein